jgi:hypothetical protein
MLADMDRWIMDLVTATTADGSGSPD